MIKNWMFFFLLVVGVLIGGGVILNPFVMAPPQATSILTTRNMFPLEKRGGEFPYILFVSHFFRIFCRLYKDL